MTDRPVIFSAPMVRALLDGRKVQTRRLAWRRAKKRRALGPGTFDECWAIVPTLWQKVRPGDRLWVRETCMPAIDAGGGDFRYAADYDADGVARMRDLQRWTPSIFMLRRASRLTLVVTETRMQRVQEIDDPDAEAEGVEPEEIDDYVTSFMDLWNTLHKPGNRWDDNPEIVALTFTVHQCNLDRMEAA